MLKTLQPNTLIVASAYPDPPFEIITENKEYDGFDIDLMREICIRLGLSLQAISFKGENFNDIFGGLTSNQYDVVISGTTITPERAVRVLFSNPYLEFNQGIAVNTQITPNIHTISDLKGLVAGIQKGNTSDLVAKKLVSEGILKDIRYYNYNEINTALEDLENGKIGLVIKLFPVLSYFVKTYPKLAVVLEMPTHEKLGIAFAKDNLPLCNAVNKIVTGLIQEGVFAKLVNRWFL